MEVFLYINILREETIKRFGYDPINILKPYSAKMVVCFCPKCRIERERPFKNAHQTCKLCHNKRVSRDTASFRGSKLKKYFKENDHPRSGVKHTEETKAKMSLAKIGKPSPMKGISSGRFGPLNSFYGKKHKEGSKRYGKNNPSYGKTPTHTKRCYYTTKENIQICFRSSWELKVAQYFDDKNISWIYENSLIHVTYYFDDIQKEGTYRPDFYLPDRNIFVEIKGLWDPVYKEKFDAACKVSKIPIQLWNQDTLKEMNII